MNAVNPLTLPRTTLDFETRSELDVREVGAWRYSEHHSTEILCLFYEIPGKDMQMWAPPMPFPEDLAELAASNDHMFEAHSAQFEVAIWCNILYKQLDVPVPKRWADTLAVCAYRAIPLGLDAVGEVLDLPVKKDKRGKYLIQQLCKPRKPLKADKKRFKEEGLTEDQWPVLWREDWALLEELYDYCGQDVQAEKMLSRTIGDLPLSEYRLWVLDQRINKRGMYVDSEAVEAAIGIIELLGTRLEAELVEITGGAVKTGDQVAKIVEWINSIIHEADIPIPNLQADTVEEWVDRLRRYADEPGQDKRDVDVLRVLEIRQILGSSSVKKLYKFRACLCDDNYIRGLLQYCGAGTGRWSGRLVQPQNFPRGNLEYFVKIFGLKGVDGASETVMNILIETIKIGGQDAIDALEVMFGDVIDALTTALRGMFMAAPGKKYHVADFAAIEAVVTAWVGGEEWKLEAFRAIQRGEKYEGADDIYCATASGMFGHPVSKEENPKERQVGKVCELAFGYQGGVGAWRNFDKSDRYDDAEVDYFKTQWREKHTATVRLWYGVQEAAVDALKLNRPVSYRMITFEPVVDAAGKWLTIILPNGRRLWYFNPQLDMVTTPWGSEQLQVSYEGRDNKKGGRWGRIRTYGGMITENIVQAISRDLMAEAMINVEKAGYSIVLTVHDEIISEDDEDFGSQEEFEQIMKIPPKWVGDCPVGLSGWEGYRYRKE